MVIPSESREYREDAASLTDGTCRLFPLLVGFMGLEIFTGKRPPLTRFVKRLEKDSGE